MGFMTRSNTNQAVQPQKMARGWKFGIEEVEELYYLSSENKEADQLRGHVTAQLICAFVFAYAESRFSHDTVHMKGASLLCHSALKLSGVLSFTSLAILEEENRCVFDDI